MKKVLLATTALVAFAGVASADVNLSGSARFGLKYTDTPAVGHSKTSLEKRMTINIDVSTETDSGLELGGRIRLRSDENTYGAAVPAGGPFAAPTGGGSGISGANVYLKAGGFKLTVGNIDGAIESMPGVYNGSVGLDGNGWSALTTNTADEGYFGWDAFSSRGQGNNGAIINYAVGDFAAALSYAAFNDVTANPDVVAAHLAYTFGDWTAALGYQDGGTGGAQFDKTVITISGKLGDFGVGLAYADNNNTSKYTLNGSYTMGATTISAFISDDSSDGTGTLATIATDNPWGLGVTYDLGGATLVAGYTNSEVGVKRATAGIKFKF